MSANPKETRLLAEAEMLPDELVDVPLPALERAAIVRSMRKHGSTRVVALHLGVSIRKIQYRVAQYRREGWL